MLDAAKQFTRTVAAVGTDHMLAGEVQQVARIEQVEGRGHHILQLPQDVLARIALMLPPVDVARALCTCKALQRVMKDEAVWQVWKCVWQYHPT